LVYNNLCYYFALFLKILIVITKAGEIRLDESLATLCQKKVLHSIRQSETDNPKKNFTFLITKKQIN